VASVAGRCRGGDDDPASHRPEPRVADAWPAPHDAIAGQDIADLVAVLHADGKARESIRKTVTALAMVFDHAQVKPNPARDKVAVRLPREEPEEPNPPSADHVEAVYRLLPSKHRLPLLFLDWSGVRVSAIDRVLIGDYDEPRRRLRLPAKITKTRRALWVELHPPLRTRWKPPCRRVKTATQPRACSGTAAPTRCGLRSGRHVGRLVSRRFRHTTFATGGSACCTCVASRGRGSVSRSASATWTANTYTHVLVSEAEVDYAALLAAAA
jgi:hypothetical protein